jgi:prepilin-type N-terminal cleavage/methylation domain-containing protein
MPVAHSQIVRPPREDGLTLLEVVLTLAIVATISGIALPLTATALDEVRTAMGARYLEARIFSARMQAIRRSARVALRFVPEADDFRFAEYADGNGNGVRTAEIAAGLDVEIAPGRLLRDSFSGVKFGLQGSVPDVDGVRTAERSDGVRVGSARILSLGPDGTATSGTLYLHGRRSQYAVRVLGATGRTRLLRFDPGSGQWIAR